MVLHWACIEIAEINQHIRALMRLRLGKGNAHPHEAETASNATPKTLQVRTLPPAVGFGGAFPCSEAI